MRKYRVEPPNFRCKVIDHHNNQTTWIGYAKSKEDLPELLRGYKEIVSIKPFNLEQWRKRAQKETDNVIKWRGENESRKTGEYQWRNTIWKYLKVHLFSVTKGKCAFCETDALTVSPGDVEHYRPKAAVDGDPAHKGYYWLAYDLQNYLPSCGNCNSSGKMNKFPVSGTRAYGPTDDLTAEKPDLLNPFDPQDDDPNKHLQFVIGNIDNPAGTVGSTTHRGNQTIEILELNRPPLVTRRSTETAQFLQKLDVEYNRQAQSEKWGMSQPRLSELVNTLRTEGAEFYSAKMAALHAWVERWEERQEAERKAMRALLNRETP